MYADYDLLVYTNEMIGMVCSWKEPKKKKIKWTEFVLNDHIYRIRVLFLRLQINLRETLNKSILCGGSWLTY